MGIWRSQLIWICTVCHSIYEFVSVTWIKQFDWLKIRSGSGILIYTAWQGLIIGVCEVAEWLALQRLGHKVPKLESCWRQNSSRNYSASLHRAFHNHPSVIYIGLKSQQLSSALASACDFKSHFCKQCGPRSDCSFRSSLIWVHTVCLYAKIGLKSLQEYSADDINMTFSDAVFFLRFKG